MRKLVAAINMTLDGFCDHTAVDPDETIHQHYTDLLNSSGVALYGRITYQLMEYWRPLVNHPIGKSSMDDFASAINQIPKIVFSRTLKNVDWESAKLADQDIEAVVAALKNQPGNNILACSPSLIVTLTQLNLIDEYQICVHPVVAGSGLPLFKNIDKEIRLQLIKKKTFDSGPVILFYEPTKDTVLKTM
jgi:dihydrofolate reductase